jgi:MFS family permease
MTRRQSSAFLWLYAVAWAGGAIAYVPFLTILLPVRVAEMAGDQRVHWIGYMTFFGAIAASVGGIGFGWLSDRTHVRRPWVVAGLVGTVALMMCVPLAHDPLQLLILIVLWQLALNMMLGPLCAWAADLVPPGQLGYLGGLLALSPALGSAAGALVTIPGLAGPDGRLALVACLVAACVLPAVIFARPLVDQAPLSVATDAEAAARRSMGMAIAMWVARFLVQISEATLFAYLYYYFRSIDPSWDASWIAELFGMVLCAAVPVSLLIGRWSDRSGRPILPLVCAALTISAALLLMAASRNSQQATAAYVVFGLATSTFLSLHSGQTLRVLRNAGRRGRDLGIFNLTNTAPSLIIPWLTVAIVPEFGFSRLFDLLAGLAVCAALILVVSQRRAFRSATSVPAAISGADRSSFAASLRDSDTTLERLT